MPLIQSTICAVFALWMFIGIAGCGESPQQMFETAQFEELHELYVPLGKGTWVWVNGRNRFIKESVI
jgi:hypothetical protein